MVRMGHSSSAAALRHQHVMAGRDAAIAAALDELVQAALAHSGDAAQQLTDAQISFMRMFRKSTRDPSW
jgi:hypothetical protein